MHIYMQFTYQINGQVGFFVKSFTSRNKLSFFLICCFILFLLFFLGSVKVLFEGGLEWQADKNVNWNFNLFATFFITSSKALYPSQKKSRL